jgi:hypothetical protein
MRPEDWARNDANIIILRQGFGLTGGNRDSKDIQGLLSKISKIDNNADPYHHLWRFDAYCYRKSP